MTLAFLTYFIEILDRSPFFSNEQIGKECYQCLAPLWVGFRFDTLFVAMIRLIQKGVLKLKCCPHFTGFSSSLGFLKMQVSGQYI